jgi:hypothetical protein
MDMQQRPAFAWWQALTARQAAQVILVGVLVLVAAPAALAAGPIHTQDQLRWDDEIVAECGTFNVLSTSADLYRNIVTWHDDDGNQVAQTRRVHFDFTFVNTTTQETAEYVGHFVIHVDSVAGTTTLTGAQDQLWVDGRKVLSVAGKAVFSPDGASFAGHSSREAFGEALCDAMA